MGNFFCILFFYSVYRVIGGSFEASIIHMAEMICLTYIMGYAQASIQGFPISANGLTEIYGCTSENTAVSVM